METDRTTPPPELEDRARACAKSVLTSFIYPTLVRYTALLGSFSPINMTEIDRMSKREDVAVVSKETSEHSERLGDHSRVCPTSPLDNKE